MLKTFEVFDAISGLIIQQIISIGWRLQRIPEIECGVFGIEMSEYHRSYNSPSFVKIVFLAICYAPRINFILEAVLK